MRSPSFSMNAVLPAPGRPIRPTGIPGVVMLSCVAGNAIISMSDMRSLSGKAEIIKYFSLGVAMSQNSGLLLAHIVLRIYRCLFL